MKPVILLTLAFSTALIQASTLHLPRAVGDLCQAPEGPGICEDVSECDGIEQEDKHCAQAGQVECCVNLACDTPQGEGLCRRTDQGCDGGEFSESGDCPGSTQCCVQPESDIEARASCSTIKKNTCSFYRSCLEKKKKCGSKGYPLAYGEHYCKKFTSARPKLSSRGKAWVTKTMHCLQTKLVPYATGTKKGSCSALKTFAFASHPNCYVRSGVCTLPPKDWKVIVNTVGFTELFSSKDALIATLKTVKGCKDFYIWLIKQGVIKMAKKIWDVTKDLGNWFKDRWKDITGWF
ncbi:hypothetical protein AJ80_09966 [Polytolypa hystricis UAMH7299]|uniref:Disintegrin domain-containing protein n=1 Tax=Polytolypa hystricis (strain UAMH7299) TaxID=1447883 RepID=A0A2B7WFP8_POLH7|nr:hypothetical protein AJ80_09966 [Polytolypa hystricis UAMH7299]